MALSIINSDVHVSGALSADTLVLAASSVTNTSVSSTAGIARSKLALDSLSVLEIPLSHWRIWDSLQQLPAVGASDDLGWAAGTFGTSAPLIRTQDVKNLGAQTLRARAQIMLPVNYESAEDVRIRAFAGMVTTIASAGASIDFEAHEITGAGVGSDLVTTAAINMNSLTFGNYDFVVTASSLVAGDMLDIRMTILVNDSATATEVAAAVAKTMLLIDVRG